MLNHTRMLIGAKDKYQRNHAGVTESHDPSQTYGTTTNSTRDQVLRKSNQTFSNSSSKRNLELVKVYVNNPEYQSSLSGTQKISVKAYRKSFLNVLSRQGILMQKNNSMRYDALTKLP